MGANRRSWRNAVHVGVAVVLCSTLLAYILSVSQTRSGAEQVIPMTVKRFEYRPREVHLKRGVPVIFEITSLDVPHGFNLPDFGVRADVIPGRPARVRLVPDRIGTFTFRCDVFCGGGHEELDGTIVVTE